MNELELQRKSLPNEPGVYLFRNKEGTVIYVGKAINLKKRVSSSFLKTTYNDPYYEEKIKEMVKEISSIEYFVTENEKEAYILENIQIKNLHPRFNVFMRDSKSYPWVAIFYGEKFPRIRVIRNPENYPLETSFIGPYTDKKEIIRILRDLRKIFPYCSCKKPISCKKRPCLYYQLNLCPGPCINKITPNDYLENVNKIELFLKGETEELKDQISLKMKLAAESQDFETAAYWRDKLQAIESSTASQNILLNVEENKDIIGHFSDIDQTYLAVVIIHIQEGRIINKSSFNIELKQKVIKKEEMFPAIMEQFYQETNKKLPNIIVIPYLYKGLDLFKQILSDYNPNIQIRSPNSQELGLLRIANKNAKVIVEQEILMEKIKNKQEGSVNEVLKEVKQLLNLPRKPHVIEGFDISNIEGTYATGSMVYFLDGKPSKKNYRHYKIRSKQIPDDVGMMREVLMRRYKMLLDNGLEFPDLILLDGGKGQLNAGNSVLKELGINVPIIALAKKREEVFIPQRKSPLQIPTDSDVSKLFQNIRDEAHRFAVRLHKKQRKGKYSGSILDEIKGIGPIKRNHLLGYFKSIEGVKNASYEELSEIVGSKLANLIKKKLVSDYS
jgi:excinuclease ABC subunit C